MPATDQSPLTSRRSILKTGLAASSLFLPLPYAWVWAQSEGTIKLLRLPKLALVIGNSKYKNAPGLNNPGNDAKAMAETLRQSGFDVTAQLDAGQNDMAAAIRTYVQTLAAKKAIGLFYFAGHGVQLAWRNYLIPVDAVVRRPDDIQKSCIDLVALMEGINKASNPLNVVILDACRDNPFGGEVRIENRGLSQMDASHSTLLAYATAPGNVASDGEGANGLYTENLLREMRIPDAKIEDVFKRVRLNVRRRTNGQQIPWESTSLEEDFYFLPPENLKKLSEEEKDRDFKKQLTIWNRIKDSKGPADFYAFLQDYPNGMISEQAQFRLDQLDNLKVEAAPGANGVKPLTSGTNRYALGDEVTWELNDRLKNLTIRLVFRVTYADNDRVEFNDGDAVVDQMGSELRNRFGTKSPGLLESPADVAIGKRWRTAFTNTTSKGTVSTNFWDARVAALEEVRVPAGSFRSFKVVASGEARYPRGLLLMSRTYWVNPATMTAVRDDLEFRFSGSRQLIEYSSKQLVSFAQAPR